MVVRVAAGKVLATVAELGPAVPGGALSQVQVQVLVVPVAPQP